MTTLAESGRAATVADLGEREIIARIRDAASAPPDYVLLGIGDDAAVVRPERNTVDVLTTDALVEGVHFDRSIAAPGDIGSKALAVNLSDLAAMGARPRAALLSLGLPETLPLADLDALVQDMLATARAFGVALVGGNVTRSPGPLFVDVTAIGAVKARRILTRSGGAAGDAVYVSGVLGGAAAGLAWTQGTTHAGDADRGPAERDAIAGCLRRLNRPTPRCRLGLVVGRARAASACIDLSDGLAEGLRQMAEACGTGARVEAATIPVDPAAREVCAGLGIDALETALRGGEDYELLFAVPQRQIRRFHAACRADKALAITRIGELTTEAALIVRYPDRDVPLPAGHRHFSS